MSAEGYGYGYGPPPVETRVATHRPWSTILLVLHWIGVVVGGVLAVIGLVVLGISAAGAAEVDYGMYEPWGFLIGGVVLVVGLVALAVCVPLLVFTIKGRRAASEGRFGMLFGVGIAATCLGGLSVLSSLAGMEPVTVTTALLLAGSYTFVGVRLAQATRRPRVGPPPGTSLVPPGPGQPGPS